MIHLFGPTGAHLLAPGNTAALSSGFVWIDCYQPTREEETLLENALGIEIPTRQEMLEIEVSNRLYEEGAVYTMTATMIGKADSQTPESGPVTFILTPNHLITLRYGEYMPFRTFISDFQKNPAAYATPDRVFSGIIDKITERLADILEKVGFEIEVLSADIFKRQSLNTQPPIPHTKQSKKATNVNLRELLNRTGFAGSIDNKARESIVSFQRLLSFMNTTRTARFCPESIEQIQTAARDLQSLSEHSHFISDKIAFLLDATLGLINIEQNDIIRIFSIGAVMFMPPTLVASLYGMNFQHIPELTWQHGYEYALLLMLLSTLIPLLFFKKKGWL
jgi:magnesium transporter